MKFKAAKKLHPAPQLQIDQVRSTFLRWQDELDRLLRDAGGFDRASIIARLTGAG